MQKRQEEVILFSDLIVILFSDLRILPSCKEIYNDIVDSSLASFSFGVNKVKLT